jgi:uncharacterized protein YjbI with pentapeptide repeats
MLDRAENAFTKGSMILVILLLWSVAARLAWGFKASVPITDLSDSTNNIQLREEKLREEIRKLQLENERLSSRWESIRSSAPFLTALVAAMGVLATIWKQIHESSTQRNLDRLQREEESLRRSNERFTSIVSDLGSASEAIQASSALSLMTFLKQEYKDFHEQVFLILLANLKIQHSEKINKLLITAFNASIRKYLEYARDQNKSVELDLSHSYLERADLSGIDLSSADLGFTQLRSANLTDAILFRVRGMKADFDKARLSRANLNEARLRKAQFQGTQFHGANIVAADLKETDLRGAQFQQAKLQSAHLDNARLQGAKFEQANLSDTFFNGADLDESTLRSIINAQNWRQAHFDDEINARLEKLAKNRG